MHHFAYRNGVLHAEAVNLDALAAAVGTPFYCYSTASLERHYNVFAGAFADVRALVCYAMKANSNQAVVKTLAKLGAGADVVSEGELMRARLAGVPADKIMFSGIGKTARELALAVDEGILCINVESEPELELLSSIAASKGRPAFVTTSRGQLSALDFAAAITGPLVIGLQVGYLPALYGASNRRESEVTMLDSRAGEPSWGPEILARHASISSLDNLADLYRGWERWAADVSESHANYPVLIYFRSQAPSRNWLVALLSVMDSAALMLSLNPSRPQGEPRMAIRMGFVCMRDLARTMNIPYDPDPDPDSDIQLTYDEFLDGIRRLGESGFPMERTPDDAWPEFKGWRINYEAIAYALAWRIDAVPALWSGPRRGPEVSLAPKTPTDRRPSKRPK
jgi:hypothetical protein